MARTTPDREGLTALLAAASGGDRQAFDRFFPLVYEELNRIARRHLRAEPGGHTLSPTALVHESYLKLVDQTRVEWQNRAHFFAVAATAMRRILLDYAKARVAAKRGGGAASITLTDEVVGDTGLGPDEFIALNDALDRMEAFNPRGAEVVRYRFFGGLSHDETAHVMELSPVTVRRAWTSAKAWLRREMDGEFKGDGP
jgi:RNA polymerase sigma factor (TIGR02999 family)